MWHKVARFILTYRLPIVLVLAVITIGFASVLSEVRLSYEYANMLPATDQANINLQEFKKEFAEDGNVMVVGVNDPRLYEIENFQKWYDLGQDIKRVTITKEEIIDGKKVESTPNLVDSVFSVLRSYQLVKDTANKKFQFDLLAANTPQTQEELDSLMGVVKNLPFYEGLLWKKDESTTILMAFVNSKIFNSQFRQGGVSQVVDLMNTFTEETGIKTYVSGLPFIRDQMTSKVKSELRLFIILSALVTAILLWLFFRDLILVGVCLLVVGIGVVWSMGVIYLFGYELSILMALIPSLVIIIGITNCVYLINKYHAEYKKHGNKVLALQRVVVKIGSATFLTNFTTAMGFGTFVFTYSDILKEFGVIASINIIVMFALSILVIIIASSYLPSPTAKQLRHLDRKWTYNSVDVLVKIVTFNRKTVYGSLIGVLILGFVGVSMMTSTGNVVDDLPEDDRIITDLRFFEEQYSGVLPFEVVIRSDSAGKMTKLSNLKRIEKLQNKLKKYPEISKSVSIADVAKFGRQAFYNGSPDRYAMIKRNEQTLIGPYFTSQYDTKDREQAFIDSTARKTRISSNVADIGTIKMKQLIVDIEAEIDTIFPPNKYSTYLTGTSVVYTKGSDYMVSNLAMSLIIAIIFVALLMSVLFRSVRMVLISLVPNLIPLLFTAAIMGYAGIPIKPSTVLVFSIAFGISVDDTIHYLAKFRQELKANGWKIKDAVISAVRETGVSMMYTSIILFFGFAVFIASEFEGTRALGILVSVTLLVAMFANLVLLPTLLLSLDKRFTDKIMHEPLFVIFDEEDDIDLDELKIERKGPH
ncbi:MAG: RND family transporter [Flavobacteriales bacterium]